MIASPKTPTLSAEEKEATLSRNSSATSLTASSSSSVNGDDKSTDSDTKQSSSHVKTGVRMGCLSAFLVFLAGGVTMPHYQSKVSSELKCDSLCQGSLTSARSALTLIGSTVVGRLSDRTDLPYNARKLFLAIGILASAFTAVLTWQATSLTELWIAMIPSALLQQNFNVLKALFGEYHAAAAVESKSENSNAESVASVGMLGMAAGFSFMVGPLAGSTLLKTYEQAAMFGLVCLLVSFIITVGPLPSVDHDAASEQKKDAGKSNTDKESVYRMIARKFIPDLVPAARTPPAIFLLIARFLMGVAFHIFQTVWTVVLKTRFNFGPKEYGQYFGFVGLCFALSQGFGAKLLLQRFGKTPAGRTRVMLFCAALLGGGRVIVYNTNSLAVVYGVYSAIIVALGVVNTIFTADVGTFAEPHELGSIFGILASMESLAGIVGPIIGGLLARIHATWAPLIAVVGCYGAVFFMIYFGYERYLGNPKKQAKSKTE